MSDNLIAALQNLVGSSYVTTDSEILTSRCVDYTGRYQGRACALVRPGSSAEVAATLQICRDAGAFVTVQGGRTSLVAGTVPEHDDVLLSTERLTEIGDVDTVERRVTVGAGVTLAQVQHCARTMGFLFGVDLTARDTATLGGMASTNAGGLRTIQYGNMADQVLGLTVALPDGSLMKRHSRVHSDNTGYDLTSLFVGAEGTLGVITDLDLQLHPIPTHRATALCAFDDLDDVITTSRILRNTKGIAALELIDGHCAALATNHLKKPSPLQASWLLLVELVGESDPTEQLARTLATAELSEEPAIGVDSAAQQRLWDIRESVAEVVTLYGPPLKFDVSLPLASIARFALEATELAQQHIPEAVALLFGHVGEGNLHLNVLRCDAAREPRLYVEMMKLIATHGGNVSSEHGVGTRKRAFLTMSRQPADIKAMHSVKRAFDPTGYLNRAVLFDDHGP